MTPRSCMMHSVVPPELPQHDSVTSSSLCGCECLLQHTHCTRAAMQCQKNQAIKDMQGRLCTTVTAASARLQRQDRWDHGPTAPTAAQVCRWPCAALLCPTATPAQPQQLWRCTRCEFGCVNAKPMNQNHSVKCCSAIRKITGPGLSSVMLLSSSPESCGEAAHKHAPLRASAFWVVTTPSGQG